MQNRIASRPARGAWIEITPDTPRFRLLTSGRAPQGARGLKYHGRAHALERLPGRAPQGARGLKCQKMAAEAQKAKSRPARGIMRTPISLLS